MLGAFSGESVGWESLAMVAVGRHGEDNSIERLTVVWVAPERAILGNSAWKIQLRSRNNVKSRSTWVVEEGELGKVLEIDESRDVVGRVGSCDSL